MSSCTFLGRCHFSSNMGFAAWWRLMNVAILGIIFFHGFCLAEKAPNYSFLHQATTSPKVSHYDYIVVGGGTAGCALAATLSEKHTVLLLERGGSPYGNTNITKIEPWIELIANGSPGSPVQFFMSEDGVSSSRPRVLGGGTAINAGFYSRAQTDYVREVGWEGKLVNESFRWVEKKVAFQPLIRGWQSAFRAGMIEAGIRPYNGFTYDHLTGTKVGGTIFDGQRNRHTSADLLEYANPRRITVLLHATVQRILFNTKGKSKPVANGVVFNDASGIEHRAYLKAGSKSEVIVSSGALGSPQLLMLSGLGPKKYLKSLKIKVVLDLPLVGQGMKDNPMNNLFIPAPIEVDVDGILLAGITPDGNYIEGGCGLNIGGGGPSHYGNFSFKKGGFILEKFSGPQSFGHLELRNRDPSDNPSVTFNYFKDPIDLQRCVRGVETILRVVESNAFSKYRVSNLTRQDILNITARFPQNFPVHANTSTSLEQFCKDTVKTIWHYHGGCQVGKVVDRDYKVLGVDALRVVDGSTFLSSPGTNPQATVMMLGRYVGVKILRGRA